MYKITRCPEIKPVVMRFVGKESAPVDIPLVVSFAWESDVSVIDCLEINCYDNDTIGVRVYMRSDFIERWRTYITSDSNIHHNLLNTDDDLLRGGRHYDASTRRERKWLL